ncbi:MAG: fluoride efflux transporter CrcB [Bacteroidota bacterium]|nr:fluoride efflux transporter CrcB [Bacteroidota bacterium]
MLTIIAIFIGGGLGSVSRFGLSKMITSNFQDINPVATLTSNFISTIILGVVLFFSSEKLALPNSIKAMLIIGFCGGFSTFSTFSWETFELIRTGNYWFAFANLFVSIIMVIGILFVMARNL